MRERLKSMLRTLAPDRDIGVIGIEDGRLAAWKGGSFMASRPYFMESVITKEEYDEYGPVMVHRKCH